MKLIFVTGGVISGLGKGITAASIGRILKDAGYTINMIKMDPYLQVDAGTMSPYEHGEVFVTDDGGEIDLDFGHYERFVGVKLSKDNSITTGKVYQHVIAKERKGDYLGQTVQVIPHVIDEIKEMIRVTAQDADVTIIEIGGTVGDIEGPHFIETMRQLRYDMGIANTCFVHVVPIIHLSHTNEYKTKAIQHSLIKLREVGIAPDCLVVRTPERLPQTIIQKLSLFSGLDENHIVQGVDKQTIYEVPEDFAKQGIGKLLQNHLFGTYTASDMSLWHKNVRVITQASSSVSIALAGKYTQYKDCDLSVRESLKHAAAAHGVSVSIIPWYTAEFEGDDSKDLFQKRCLQDNIQGVLVPGGFGERGVEGMIRIAHYTYDQKIPYLGVCLGLQVACIARIRYGANKLKAHSTEFDPHTPDPVVSLMDTQKNLTALGGTMRLGAYPAVLREDSLIRALYEQWFAHRMQSGLTHERHRHRYEVSPAYHDLLNKHGIVLSGTSPDGKLVEHIEAKNHPYYVATQAHPEFLSQLDSPHPLFAGLLQAAMSYTS